MQPLGRKKLKLPGKVDFHPKRGFMNWWETIVNPSKAYDKRNAEKEINQEILTMDEDYDEVNRERSNAED